MHLKALTIIFASQICAQFIEQLIDFFEIHFTHFDSLSPVVWHNAQRKMQFFCFCIYFFYNFFVRGKSLTSRYTRINTRTRNQKKKITNTHTESYWILYLTFGRWHFRRMTIEIEQRSLSPTRQLSSHTYTSIFKTYIANRTQLYRNSLLRAKKNPQPILLMNARPWLMCHSYFVQHFENSILVLGCHEEHVSQNKIWLIENRVSATPSMMFWKAKFLLSMVFVVPVFWEIKVKKKTNW